ARSAGRVGRQAAGPALPPGVARILHATDVVDLLEEAVLARQVRDCRDGAFVGAVDEHAGQGRIARNGVGAGSEGGFRVCVVEVVRAGEEDRLEDCGAAALRHLLDAQAGQALARAAGLAGDHGVVDLGAAAEVDGEARAVAAAATGAADVGEVRDLRVRVLGVRQRKRIAAVGARPLVHVVAGAVALDHHAELHAAVPAGVDVEAVIAGAGDHDAPGVDRAAEDLDAVVGAVVDLHVLDGGAAADAAHGQALELVATGEGEAGVLDLHVLHGAGVVGGRVAAVHAEVTALDPGLASCAARLEVADAGVDRRTAGEHQAAPATVGLGVGIAFDVDLRGQDDRLLGGAERIDLRAAVDDQGVGAGGGVHGHARLDVEDAFARTGPRSGRVATHVLADVDGTIDGVDGAGSLRDREFTDDPLRQFAGAEVGDGADVPEALRAVLGRTTGRRRRRRWSGRRRRRRSGRRRRECAFTGRSDAVGTATAGTEREHRAKGHEEGLGTMAHGHRVGLREEWTANAALEPRPLLAPGWAASAAFRMNRK